MFPSPWIIEYCSRAHSNHLVLRVTNLPTAILVYTKKILLKDCVPVHVPYMRVRWGIFGPKLIRAIKVLARDRARKMYPRRLIPNNNK
jgi:hypothetical protein